MNIFELAKAMEKEGELAYRELADASEDAGLKLIFTTLADNEVKHYDAIVKMEQDADADFAEDALVNDAKEIFTKMKERAANFHSGTPQEDVYMKALEGENKAVEFYQGLLEQADTEAKKAVVQKIIEEEKQHVVLMQNMVDFIRAPQMWLENAEFNNMSAY
jgi:rubrerythrin